MSPQGLAPSEVDQIEKVVAQAISSSGRSISNVIINGYSWRHRPWTYPAVTIAACHAELKASDGPMPRVAPEPFPAADEPFDAAVPDSSLLTLPGEAAPAPSEGSPDEIAPAVSLQVQASMRLSPPPYPGLLAAASFA